MSLESHSESTGRRRASSQPNRNVSRIAGRDAIVLKAPELLDDPGYPSDAIVEDLADIMTRYGVFPLKGEPDA